MKKLTIIIMTFCLVAFSQSVKAQEDESISIINTAQVIINDGEVVLNNATCSLNLDGMMTCNENSSDQTQTLSEEEQLKIFSMLGIDPNTFINEINELSQSLAIEGGSATPTNNYSSSNVNLDTWFNRKTCDYRGIGYCGCVVWFSYLRLDCDNASIPLWPVHIFLPHTAKYFETEKKCSNFDIGPFDIPWSLGCRLKGTMSTSVIRWIPK